MKEIYFAGNAPTLEGDLAKESTNNPVVYYLPGTTGWLPTFGSLPTELWKPRIDSRDANFGFRTNQFGFNISWKSGRSVVVEACTNLTSPTWEPLQTNILASDSFYFSDPEWKNFSTRLYRISAP